MGKDVGFVIVPRKWAKEKMQKPFSKFEAELWLVINSSYENGDSGTIDFSYDFLAKEWGWITTTGKYDRKKVHRFLENGTEKGLFNIQTMPQTVPQNCNKNATHRTTLSINYYNDMQNKDEKTAQQVLPKCHTKGHKGVLDSKQSKDVTSPFNKYKNNKTIYPSDIYSAKEKTDYQKFMDHIWRTYETKYGTKPARTEAAFKRLNDQFKFFGLEESIKAWDGWLESDNPIAVESNHSIQTFASNHWFNKHRVDAVKLEAKSIERPYRDIIPERKSRG